MAPRSGHFRRADRLRRSAQFESVKRAGRRAAGNAFVVQVAQRRASGDTQPRLGITVSRRVGRSVARNRVKRRVREWFRSRRELLEASVDVVVIGRAAAVSLAYDELDRELCELVRKVGAAERRGIAR